MKEETAVSALFLFSLLVNLFSKLRKGYKVYNDCAFTYALPLCILQGWGSISTTLMHGFVINL